MLETPPFMDDFPIEKKIHGIPQHAMFDYQRVHSFAIETSICNEFTSLLLMDKILHQTDGRKPLVGFSPSTGAGFLWVNYNMSLT